MKNILYIIGVLSIALSMEVYAQSPSHFNYQAVVRDASGSPLTGQAVSLRFSILKGSQAGTVAYSESFQLTSNDFGLINLQIGNGSPISGDFNTIEWGASNYYLRVEMDENGGSNYQQLGETPFVSVPYAKYADKAGDVSMELGRLTDVNVSTPPDQGNILVYNGQRWVVREQNTDDGDWGIRGDTIFSTSSLVNVRNKLEVHNNIALLNDTNQLVLIRSNPSGSGDIITKGINGNLNTKIGQTAPANPNLGSIAVYDAQGDQKARMGFESGKSIVETENLEAKKFSLEADAGTDPLILKISGTTKLKMHDNGGLSIGTATQPDANGLEVSGIIATSESLVANHVSAQAGTGEDPIIARVNNSTKFKVHDNGGVSIGSGFQPLNNGLWVEGELEVNGDKLHLGNSQFEYIGSSKTTVNSHFLPHVDINYTLGNSDNRWNSVWAVNGGVQTSDIREKQDIIKLDYGLEELMKLRPVSFSWIKDRNKERKIGLIAQELLPHIPEVVKTHDWKYGEDEDEAPQKVELDQYGVFYSDLIPVLIKAIQEQQKQIENQQAQIKTLIQKVN